MKRRIVEWVFVGLCATTIVALTFLALTAKRSPLPADGDGHPPSSIPESMQAVLRPIPKVVESRATLPSGLEVTASYHFNRHALTGMVVAPECVLALMDSGNLLRFDREDLRLTDERVPPVAGVVLIYIPEKGAFVGCADGAVFRIDLGNLELTQVARLSGRPSWMGFYLDPQRKEHTLLAAVQKFGGPEKAQLTLYRFTADPPSFAAHELPRGIPMGLATAFFVDGQNQLWLGGDQGEWGGWCARVDLNSGKLVPVERTTGEGVYGFVGLPDGQVWAYGGTMHLGISRAFVARVDQGEFKPFEGLFGQSSEQPHLNRPSYPITHMVPDPGGDGLLVFAYADWFRTDFGMKNWHHLGQMSLHYTGGRPDAMGSYPAIKTVQPLGGDSKDLLCATGSDGLLRISGGQLTSYMLDGQIGDELEDILPAADGAIIWASGPWKFDGERWQRLPFTPPLELGKGRSWYEFRPLLDRDRNLAIVSDTDSRPGPVAITRWKGITPTVIANTSEDGTERFNVQEAFATPDSEFWHTSHANKLFRLTAGKWQPAGTVGKEQPWNLRAVATTEPPWIILGRVELEERLFQLHPGKGCGDARLEAVLLPADLGSVWDAVSWSRGKILLATEAGLRLWDRSTGKVADSPFTPPKSDVHALCRDGLGRLWLAGKGVWMVDAAGVVHDLGRMSLPEPAWRIIADPKHDDGVVVGSRGVLFVRAAPARR